MVELLPDISKKLDHILAGLPGILPEMVLAAAFIASIFSGLLVDRWWKHGTFALTLTGIGVAAWCSAWPLAPPYGGNLLFGMVMPDGLGQSVRLLTALVCALFAVAVNANPDFTAHRKRTADLYSVLLALHIGLNLMAMATNWLMLFVAIEMVSIGSYVLVGYLAKTRQHTEAAMKYVLFGAACSAVMLYGLSFLYGFTGQLDYTAAAYHDGLNAMPPALVTVALLLVFAGIGFKLSFVPFHFWTPDVYQGAPTPVTAFLSTAPKIAGMAMLGRILHASPVDSAALENLHLILIVAAAATMLLGNLAALRQTNVKRMMAYSSIGHTGFLMMAVLAYASGEYTVLLFYLAVYALMNMGVFMLADYIEGRTGADDVDGYRGLGKVLPLPFVCFVILLVSLTGLPPTAGFIAKLLVFSAAFSNWQLHGDPGMMALLIIGALTTVISLFYYFKVPLNAFLRKSSRTPGLRPLPAVTVWVVALLSAAVLLLGVFPGWLMTAP